MRKKSIKDVKDFWDNNPLWIGESIYKSGTIEFFEEHRNVYINDVFAGTFDSKFLPAPRNDGQNINILDIGCGIGFWTVEFGLRGYSNIVSCDLTDNALEITKKRLNAYKINAKTHNQNVEELTYSDNAFDHINCQGVIHHTPNTELAIKEIARVLKTSGTASISVYYDNIILRYWWLIRILITPIAIFGLGLIGRGREKMARIQSKNDLVRIYDGLDNPIGKCYSRKAFEDLFRESFIIDCTYFHFFPARALPFKINKLLHRILEKLFPFMIHVNLKKK